MGQKSFLTYHPWFSRLGTSVALPFAYLIGVPEQALGWVSLGLGLVCEDKPSEFSCSSSHPVSSTHRSSQVIHLL